MRENVISTILAWSISLYDLKALFARYWISTEDLEINSAGEVVLKADRTTLDYDRNEFAYLIRDSATNRVGAEFNYQIAMLG